MWCQVANNELKQVQRLNVDLHVIVSEQVAKKERKWLDQVSRRLWVDLGKLLLDSFLDFDDRDQALLWIRQLQGLNLVFVTF